MQPSRFGSALGLSVAFVASTLIPSAYAQTDPPNAATPAQTPTPPPSAAPVDPSPDGGTRAGATQEVKLPESTNRAASILPAPAETPPDTRVRFDVDPVADGALILGVGGFALLLDEVNSTGEIRPQQISPNFNRAQLLAIDRGALSQNPDSKAGMLSNVGLYAAVGYALIDPLLSGVREKNVQSGIVDALMYAESIAITWGLTNLAKMAVRRPRPLAYIEAEKHRGDPNWSIHDTDSALSFFSGHASITASIGATATYLAFSRSPQTARPWITLVAATGVTTFVAVERVFSAKHFPTDVIAGALAGAGVGLLVPLVHRSEGIKQRAVWVGFAPSTVGRGGVLQAGAPF